MILGFIFKKTFELYDYGLISMFVSMPFFMAAFEGLANEYRGKVRENVCLDECH
jgi:energy-converting hydrogenase Eha subunit H